MKLIPDKHFPELKMDPKTGIFYVVKYMKGKGTLFRSTGETDREKARKEALRMLTEFTGLAFKGYVPTFADIAQQILADKDSVRFDQDTYLSAKYAFKRLIPRFGGIRADSLSLELFEKYVDACRDENPECRLFNDMKHYRMVCVKARAKGFLRQEFEFINPDEDFEEAGRELSETEIARLLKAATGAKWSKYIPPKPILVQMVAAYTMGMRKREILRLRKSNVDMEKREIHLEKKMVKTRQGRRFKMNPYFYELLKRHLDKYQKPRFKKKYGSSPWIFPSPTDHKEPVGDNKTAWQALKKQAKVQCRFHDLRHTFLTRALLVLKLNPSDVSVYAGVSLATLYKVYLHPHPEHTKDIANAILVEQLMPAFEVSTQVKSNKKAAISPNQSGNSGKRAFR